MSHEQYRFCGPRANSTEDPPMPKRCWWGASRMILIIFRCFGGWSGSPIFGALSLAALYWHLSSMRYGRRSTPGAFSKLLEPQCISMLQDLEQDMVPILCNWILLPNGELSVTLFTLRQTSEELTPPLSDQVWMGLQVKCSEKWPFFHRSEQNLRFVSAVSFVVVKLSSSFLFLTSICISTLAHYSPWKGRTGDDDPPLLSCKELAPSQLVRLKYRLTLNYTHSSTSTDKGDKGWKHGHPWFWRAVWQSQNSISAGKEPADASAECRFRKMSCDVLQFCLSDAHFRFLGPLKWFQTHSLPRAMFGPASTHLHHLTSNPGNSFARSLGESECEALEWGRTVKHDRNAI